MDYDVIVIGGGPVGCAVARDVAQSGYRVLVLEEHSKIGEPVQCAGLISPRTLKISRVSSKVVLSQLKGARVHAPGKKILNLEGKKVYALVIDRAAFDRELSEQALNAGAEIVLNGRAVKFSYFNGGVQVAALVNGTNYSFSCRLLIGADGYNSSVARWMGCQPAGEKILTYAAEVRLSNCSGKLADIFLDRNLAPGWFGWLIPIGDNKARVGIGFSKSLKENGTGFPRLLFKKLAEKHLDIFQDMEIISTTGGIIPVGFLEKTYDSNVLLVGDAASQVKPISGGGLYLGLSAACFCAATAVEALAKKNFSKSFLSTYQNRWEEAIGLEIRCGLKHREVFLTMKNEEMNFIIGFLNKPYWQKLILKYGDLDLHSKLAGKLLLAPPWAKRFLTGGLRGLIYCSRIRTRF